MAKKKSKVKPVKKESTGMKVIKIAVPAAIGAVAGALGLRWVDRTFGSKLPASMAPETQAPAIAGDVAQPNMVENPMSHPLAAAAISPVLVSPMYGAPMQHWPGYAGNPGGTPPRAPTPQPVSHELELPDPEAEAREREREFDELVEAFENGNVAFH